MIDFHTHILPDIDDGSRDVAQSLKMLRREARFGVETVVLTPHYRAEVCSPREFLEKRRRSWEMLEPHLKPGLPRLLLGAEVHYFEGMGAVRDLEQLCIQGTNLLLLEMPMTRWTERMVDAVLELNRKRFQVVMAHIERYLSMQSRATIERLLDGGVLFQVSVDFFDGWLSRLRAMGMVRRGEVHLLGTDCHNLSNRAPNWNLLPPEAAVLHGFAQRLLEQHSKAP